MAKKILLVDDDPDVLNLLGRVLEKAGYKVNRCDNGTEVEHRVATEHPDLIVLDMQLADMDGREVASSLKEKESFHIPIIMISGHNTASTTYQNYGIDDFLSKPINTKFLLDKIDYYINHVN